MTNSIGVDIKNEDEAESSTPRSGVTPMSILVLVAVGLAYFLAMLDTTIVGTAIPQITTVFHSLSDVGWYGTAYQLANCAVQPLSGKIYTYFNTQWSFFSFFLIFELGSVVCGTAQSSVAFIIGRAVAGVGASGLLNGCLLICSASFPPSRLPSYQGVLISTGQLGVALGPFIGGVLTEYASWRWCFFINLPIGGVTALILLLTRLPQTMSKPGLRTLMEKGINRTLDIIGFALFALTTVLFFLALQVGSSRHIWSSAQVIGSFAGSGIALVLFLCWEYSRGMDAMIPFFLLRRRAQWCASLLMFGFLGMMFIMAYYLPIYFQAVKGDSPLLSGVHNLAVTISQVVLVLCCGFITQKVGYQFPFILSGTTLVTVGAGLLSTLGTSTKAARWILYQIIYGIGVGVVVQTPFVMIQTYTPKAHIPSALAILIFTQYFGAALFVSVAQSVFETSLRDLLSKDLNSVQADAIIKGGATAVRSLVSDATQLQQVLAAYASSINRVMYLATALGAMSFIFGCGLSWENVRLASRSGAQTSNEDATALEKNECG
ncbi:MFS general substrate transporter [Xylaria arbuscula]|nr:MFS general substrate transporter [Xylaria arbuscula]